MNVLSYPLRYLTLKDENGHHLFRRNSIAALLVTAVLTLPFIIPGANYFGDNGFLDRFGSVAAVLTGFYVAALVGIASFASSLGDLDKIIEIGKISGIDESGAPVDLSRRQYVCSMFGYLAFVCLALSTISVLLVVIVGVVKGQVITSLPSSIGGAHWFRDYALPVARLIIIGSLNLVIAHMIVTTFHGLYYLIERLYDKEAELEDKDDEPPSPTHATS